MEGALWIVEGGGKKVGWVKGGRDKGWRAGSGGNIGESKGWRAGGGG